MSVYMPKNLKTRIEVLQNGANGKGADKEMVLFSGIRFSVELLNAAFLVSLDKFVPKL